MRAGRLLIDQQRDDARSPCACGHAASLHHEKGYGNPGHEAGVFHCDVCACANYKPATHKN